MHTTGSNTTTLLHYKDAAERHLQACNILFKQLQDPQNFRFRDKYHNIAAELYYLSGYIVECTINYKYLAAKGFRDDDNYDQPNRWDAYVRLKGHFQFISNDRSCKTILGQLPSNTLPPFLISLGNISNSTLVGNEPIEKEMQKRWNPSVRYSYESTGLRFTGASVSDIEIYYKAAKKLFNDLI